MKLLVAIKWSALRTEVDQLSGTSRVTPGRFGPDPASLAALAWASRLAAEVGAEITAATVGPAEAENGLRPALALGAARAVRVEGPAGVASLDVATALAPLAAEADLVVLGARSVDRGSAAVAPALAATLGRPSACGLLSVVWRNGDLFCERRLPAGRREHVRVALPAVISVETCTIAPSRAALPAVLTAADAAVEVIAPEHPLVRESAGTVMPYRPRPRSVPRGPSGDAPHERIASLTGALEAGSQAQEVRLPAAEAATEIVATLRRWGYLDGAEPEARG